MLRKKISALQLVYPPDEAETAALVEEACQRSLQAIRDNWELEPPGDCRVYVMTSWSKFLFDSAPWNWRLLLAVTLPLWVWRVRRTWQVAGGWSQRFGRRQVVGVKPARLIATADKRLGERIFVQPDDPGEKVRQITCHELAHACTAHLRLPSWLNEGLAMVTVDRFAGQPTVRQDTLAALARSAGGRDTARLNLSDQDAVVRHYVRGYWITRLLAETDLAFLRELLQKRHNQKELEAQIANQLGLEAGALWNEIDALLAAYTWQPVAPINPSGLPRDLTDVI